MLTCNALLGDPMGRCLAMLCPQLTVAESAVCATKDQVGQRARRDLDLLLKRANLAMKKQAQKAQKSATRSSVPAGKS